MNIFVWVRGGLTGRREGGKIIMSVDDGNYVIMININDQANY